MPSMNAAPKAASPRDAHIYGMFVETLGSPITLSRLKNCGLGLSPPGLPRRHRRLDAPDLRDPQNLAAIGVSASPHKFQSYVRGDHAFGAFRVDQRNSAVTWDVQAGSEYGLVTVQHARDVALASRLPRLLTGEEAGEPRRKESQLPQYTNEVSLALEVSTQIAVVFVMFRGYEVPRNVSNGWLYRKY